jgi:DegV family protein with EDD domain
VIGFCTDSGAQLPDDLRARHRVAVVPLSVTVDGDERIEGVDLGPDEFYALLRHTSDVQTAAPPPGRFLEAWAELAAAGVTDIVSIHTGSEVSATFDAARIAAGLAPDGVTVHLVDSHTASFAVGCCLWEAAQAHERGAPLGEILHTASSVASTVGNVFIVGALDLVRAGGRLAEGTADAGDIPVLSLVDGRIAPIARAATIEEATEAMAAYVLALGDGLRVGLSIADTAAAPLWEALEARLTGDHRIREIVRYRVGPSVGAHSGPGTAGACAYPSRF